MSVISFIMCLALMIVHFINIGLNEWTFIGTCLCLGLTVIGFAIETRERKDK